MLTLGQARKRLGLMGKDLSDAELLKEIELSELIAELIIKSYPALKPKAKNDIVH